MNLNFEDIQTFLQKQFYINVPFPIARSTLEEAVQAFLKFLKEPEPIKSTINFSIALKHRRGDVGYKHRNASEDIYTDNKDFFHYHPELFKKYSDFLQNHPIVYDFVLKAKPIWELAYHTVSEILKNFEPSFPGIYDKIFNTEHVHLLLRFLRYDWHASGKYLAKPHFDAGSFTLAIAESDPGLRIGSCPDNLQLVEHKPQNAIFMLSSNFQKIMHTNKFEPGWHDVVQLDETFIGKPFARWAIVAFIEAHDVEALPRTETHRWYK
jgi:hypothetical protein